MDSTQHDGLGMVDMEDEIIADSDDGSVVRIEIVSPEGNNLQMPVITDADEQSMPARQADAADTIPAMNNNRPESGNNEITVLDTSNDEDPFGTPVTWGKHAKYSTSEDGTYHLVAHNMNTPEARAPLTQFTGPMTFSSSFTELMEQDAQPRDKDSIEIQVHEVEPLVYEEKLGEELHKSLLERMGIIDDGLHLMSTHARKRQNSREQKRKHNKKNVLMMRKERAANQVLVLKKRNKSVWTENSPKENR